MRRKVIAAAVMLSTGWALAGCPASAAGPPAATTTQSTSDTDPEARKILEELESAGRKYLTLKAQIDYRVDNRETGDNEIRTGWIAYQRQTDKTQTKFRVHFATLKQGAGRRTRARVDYAFDGRWLTVAKHSIKQMTRYQVAAEGENIETFRLGKGPFPLPFGQKAKEVMKYFEVSTLPLGKKDPQETDHLLLKTRRQYRKEMSFRSLEIWVSKKTRLPARIKSTDKSRNVTTVAFKKIETDKKFTENIFHMKRRLGWEYRVERMER